MISKTSHLFTKIKNFKKFSIFRNIYGREQSLRQIVNLSFDRLHDYRVAKFFFILADILSVLGHLTRIGETQDLTFPELRSHVNNRIADLEALIESPGYWERRFSSRITESADVPRPGVPTPEFVEFDGVDLKFLPSSYSSTAGAKKAYIKAVVKDIKWRWAGKYVIFSNGSIPN